MKRGKAIVFRLAGVFTILVFLAACDSKSKDPFATANFNPFDQGLPARIQAYNDAVTSDSVEVKNANPALYIDFSSGIYKAFADPAIRGMMTNCFNTVLAEKFDVYKLGSNDISPLNVANLTELGQQVSDPAQYVDIWAPIQSAVEKIVEGNSDALLITDFEEWQKNNEVTNTAFLKIPFSKWLKKGNSIHFFIADYKEGTVDKHLYFAVFSSGTSNESGMIGKLAPKLAPFTSRFDLSDHSYKLRNEYGSEKSGGVFYDESGKSEQAKNVLDLKDSYVNGLKSGKSYEFYPLGVDWKTIDGLHTTYKSQNQFNDFFRKLYVDLSNDDSYSFAGFGVKVSDVTEDFEQFAKSAEAKKHKPKLVKGSDGEDKFADTETDPIALACYDTKGKLKDQWSYQQKPAEVMNEVFTLNKTLFTNTRNTDSKNVEFAVAFDPMFNLKNIHNPEGLMKVDILINKAEPNMNGAKLSKFQWKNAKGIQNIALYESIKNTLQELKPDDKVIYSYYIKTQQ